MTKYLDLSGVLIARRASRAKTKPHRSNVVSLISVELIFSEGSHRRFDLPPFSAHRIIRHFSAERASHESAWTVNMEAGRISGCLSGKTALSGFADNPKIH